MKRIKTILLCVCLLLLATGVASAQAKVAVFDAQAVSENSELGKRIQAQLTAFTESKEAEIAARHQAVADMRKQLTQQSLSLSADRRSEMEKDIQRQMLDLQSFQVAASRELELEYASATKDFQDKLFLTIEAFGAESGFTVILDRTQVAWFASAVDVTSAILDRFNAMHPNAAAEGS